MKRSNPETTITSTDSLRESKFTQKPFPHAKFSNFLTDTELKTAIEYTSSLDLVPKANDLYSFHQTVDICNDPKLKFVKEKLQDFASKHLYPDSDFQSNIELSMFYAEYKTNDYLLCHDDKLKQRRFAWILYLTESWKDEDGGHLDLFESDVKTVSKSMIPEYGNLVVFEVCPNSFHQVREVLSEAKIRRSLTGWFMGATDWMEDVNNGSKNPKISKPFHGIFMLPTKGHSLKFGEGGRLRLVRRQSPIIMRSGIDKRRPNKQ